MKLLFAQDPSALDPLNFEVSIHFKKRKKKHKHQSFKVLMQADSYGPSYPK